MSVIKDTWRHLVRQRLWPLAVLLLAALVAVPTLLAAEPAAPVVPPAQPAVDTDPAVDRDPIVAMAAAEDRSRRRRVLGVRKNPFEPVPVPTATPAPAPGAGDVSATEFDPSPSVSTGGASPSVSAGGGYSPAPSVPYTPPGTPADPGTDTPERTYSLYELTVRFGEDGGSQRMQLERLEALPDADDPLLVYLGPGKDGRSAIFMVDASVATEGDATCDPDPLACETIELREGETQFLDVIDPETGASTQQYQLDLVKIHRAKTSDAKRAARARAAESKAGRRALEARVAASGPLRYDYDRATGTVERLDRRTFKAKVARHAVRVARVAEVSAGL